MRKFRLCVNWFKSPADLCLFINRNKISPKTLISINRIKIDELEEKIELWWWSRKRWSDL